MEETDEIQNHLDTGLTDGTTPEVASMSPDDVLEWLERAIVHAANHGPQNILGGPDGSLKAITIDAPEIGTKITLARQPPAKFVVDVFFEGRHNLFQLDNIRRLPTQLVRFVVAGMVSYLEASAIYAHQAAAKMKQELIFGGYCKIGPKEDQ